ncbi:Slam-dependent surface lipoprotein, partial [Pseudomonas aeruginosa]|uniref:Slam-dependent surface lipoprotein n=1 Tax=Pseudomonas aeruginosa TaxID=287 RepID=UPI001604D34D
ESGAPGVGLQNVYDGKRIAFSGLKMMAPDNADGIHVLKANNSGHGGGMGEFHFAQVANADVYYGDWSKTGQSNDPTHTAYYSGKDATTSIPTTGSAEYTIAGINQNVSGQLTGVFNADFATKKYTGSLNSQTLNITMNGGLQGNGGFAGSALANGTVSGQSSGQFFGPNAQTVAGITTFDSDHSKDTAFGGNKK